MPSDQAGYRLDQALARMFPQFSRSRIKQWIESGDVLLDGKPTRPRQKLMGGEQVLIRESLEPRTVDRPQEIPLEIVDQGDDFLVINKPVGLVVHPGAGNPDGTLVNALLNFDVRLEALPRAGIVHRLDKGTSGLLLVARDSEIQQQFSDMLARREITREYQAVCRGVLTAGGTVDQPLDRHPNDRRKMTVRPGGRNAITHYRVIERFRGHSHVRVNLETGRTHQIRAHFAHLRHALVGDSVYGGRLAIPAGASEELADTLRKFSHQALHAGRLALSHPRSGKAMDWGAEIPADFAVLIRALRRDAENKNGTPT
ncbi:MAG: 23S rRNA pseudouridine(1911/1915/1917) synthase RluD [Gammaproteobacteria bacterium]|nr:23S rRNA pseudouridine(1911/1915/1917) synthase RluD [Gammaproteobacteria bacterium]